MMMLALLIAAQPSPELVERADQASQVYIGCLFAQSREAHAERIPVADFKSRLAGACLAEERAAQRLMTDVLAKRGVPEPAVLAKRLTGEARTGVVATHEKLPQLEKLAEICRQRPDACE